MKDGKKGENIPDSFYCKFIPPAPLLADFVESIGMFHNPTDEVKEVVVMPDGRIDLFFLRSGSGKSQVMLIGLETVPEQRMVPPHTLAYVISFKPLGVEYILQTSIAELLNTAKDLPDDFWGLNISGAENFELFYEKASMCLEEHLPEETDERKRKLFDLIYFSSGEMSVKELSEKVFWGSRQINRYFTRQFGLSLKAYCNILRFRASLEHIARGKLFPELNFTDQNHFIKEVKKFSGVIPKELSKNKNDRFVLLSVLQGK
jgi:AraC-like DNA-binding protein